MAPRINLEAILTFLVESAFFAELTTSELSEITAILDIQQFGNNEIIFTEGDIADAWYVIFSGEVSVSKHIPFHKDNKMAVLSATDVFGEMAILDSSPRSATVKAKGEVVVLRFLRRKFERLLEEGKLGAYKIVYQMARVLVERHRDLNEQVASLMQEIEDIESELSGDPSDVIDRTDMFTINP